MKKILLFCIIILSITLQWNDLRSQSLEITKSDTLVIGDANDLDNLPHSYATIKNNSFNTLYIKAKLTIEQLGQGHLVAFCLGMCYPPTDHDMISPGSFELTAGQETQHNDFYATLEHGGNVGITIIKFRFFDVANENDYVEYRCTFNVIYSSVEDEFITQVTISEPYPNPIKDYLHFNFSNYSSLSNPIINIYNINGIMYLSQSIASNNESISFNLSALPTGVYYYFLDFNGKRTKSKQFIITH